MSTGKLNKIKILTRQNSNKSDNASKQGESQGSVNGNAGVDPKPVQAGK